MGEYKEWARKVTSITEDQIESGLLKIMQSDDSYAIDLNTRQLLSGRDSKRETLMHYRSAAYAEFKLSLNPAGVTDLHLTGQFYRGFFMDASKFPVVIWSKDQKVFELTQKYGDDIFGLNKQSLSDFAKDILPEVQNFYRQLVGLSDH